MRRPRLTRTQKRTIQAIVNVLETGRVGGDYGRVTVLRGDAGHLTYGRAQTTLASGNLGLLVRDYYEAGGRFSKALGRYLPAFERRDVRLDRNERVQRLLRDAGGDPVMRRIQDAFFDRVFWRPTLHSAAYLGIRRPLSVAVIYDSRIHGSFYAMRAATIDAVGRPEDVGEHRWVRSYVSVRRKWLATHRNRLLRKTVYRMQSFAKLIAQGRWSLALPLVIRGVVVSRATLRATPAGVTLVSAGDAGERVLALTRPRTRGTDVRRLQRALGLPRHAADGRFGVRTDRAVRAFQRWRGLKIDGMVGPATWSALGTLDV